METPETTRRGFYVAAIQGLGALIGAALAVPAAIYLLVKPSSKREAQWVQAADVNQLQVNKPEEVMFRRKRIDGWRTVNEKTTAWVVKMNDQSVVAFAPNCTHLACAYHWDAQQNSFICPCHASVFSVDGKVLAGPAPRPLDRYASRVESGKLMIGQTIIKSA
ncbi:MAG TPA: ubiquinol-cytochrome c reductase iron-sulfur subunit [Bryobacteraceae bacterium]|nr:ubiquinol-cytochrome c reductase iron-sulfur subunit [Bryobacteraceae bacterium]